MHSITEHRYPPYIEITVFERYPENYRKDFEEVVKRYAAEYPEFSLLEVQHGKISNGLWRLLQTGGNVRQELLEAFKSLKRVAVVSDEPGILLRLISKLPRFGSAEIKIFQLHELDQARGWMNL
ncbi:STAS/SEC14 domain-containing protein [Hyphococcus sp.]|uniref:STAS/SEC14 domain-containing protein n=1 Tax=Hyphococcus sp. TaxID=2038636 RepID=UPI003CCBE248